MLIIYDQSSYNPAINAINRPYLVQLMREALENVKHDMIKSIDYATRENNILLTTIDGVDNFLIELEDFIARILSIDNVSGEKKLVSEVFVGINDDDFERQFTVYAFGAIQTLF